MSAVDLYLTEPQERFVFTDAIHPGFIAGYGAGKSRAAVTRLAIKALQYPGMSFAFVEPTYDLVRLIAWREFEEVVGNVLGLRYTLNKAESVLTLENGSQIIFRSADNPARLVGFTVADVVVDEIDILRPEHAQDVWIKMLGRARQRKPDGAPNTVAAASTPEGFAFAYNMWGKAPLKNGYELIQAPTSSNPYLPAGYLDTLRETYPANLLLAYSQGEFVNLTQGSVYPEFNRTEHASSETVKPGDTLHIGMDFNVTQGAAAIIVLRGDDPHAVYEYTGVFDTPAMVALLKRDWPSHPVMVYPDASGKNRKSQNASESDIALLKQAGFRICVNPANPAVKDRVLSVNAMLRSKRLRVNPQHCPALVEALEQQPYDKHGEPDKSGGHDHILDALGYAIAYRYPLTARPAMSIRMGMASAY